ncbi:glycosyltransferase family 4 protein [Cloacibacterium sp.]|uniref:glycosyltransferase family 4 protein n=1 Tax=Cloacibacterium sp. TaxID=1913682 RepID=UPI0039E31E33
MNKKIVISHPNGNPNLRGVLKGFDKLNSLESFHTTVATFPENTYDFLSRLPGLKEFQKRAYDQNISTKTICYPYRELGRMIAQKLNIHSLLKHEKGLFCIDQVYQSIDKHVAQYLKNNHTVDAIYAYEDGALHSFQQAKKQNIKCLYDLPIGYWRTMHKLLKEEKDKLPEWAITLGGFNDSFEKLERKDEELRLADQIFVASSFTKKTLEDFPQKLENIHVIPYGFSTPNESRVYETYKNRKIKLLFVGGLSQRKGIAYLFEAVKGLENYIELTIVGKGKIDECAILKKELSKHHYIPSLPHDEILKLMSHQDVFVFPSLFEGFGLVITEAMSQGTPVITTDRTCGKDIIQNNENGWIINAGEAVSLRKKIIEIIDQPEILEYVGKNAMKTSANRPWVNYSNELALEVQKYISQ